VAARRPPPYLPGMTDHPDVPLIPRSVLFGNPLKAAGRLSPDGRWFSWLAPRDGVLNLWLAPADGPDEGRAMTAETSRPIREYFWSADSRLLLYVQDKAGDENFLLYAVDVESGAERLLTPFENTRVLILGTSTKHRDRVLVGLNNRDARWHDVHRLDLHSGALTEVFRGDGFAGFLTDDELALRMALRPNAEGGMDFHRVTDGVAEADPFARTTLEDALTTQPAGFTADGTTLYWLDSRGRDTAALVAQDVATGAATVIAEDPRADISAVLAHPLTGVVEAYAVNHLRTEWTAFDARVDADLAYLRDTLGGDIQVTSRTLADDRWTVAVDPVTRSPRLWLFERATRTLSLLYVTRAELDAAPLVPMQPVEIRARDGLSLVSYLTLPADRVEGAPVPMVLLVHGGPWARDGYGYNPYHQWLANRGYAVLSVNFRGSTGFGKRFIAAGNLEWGARMHEDLLDAVDWAVAGGIADPARVAIMGGSYGGYATLAGLAFTPDMFACGVDIVGPSNLETLLATIPPYWTAAIEQFHQRMGNPTTTEGLALLRARSPLHAAGRIRRPLLIGQGTNDPRVKKAESDQIVDAMHRNGIPVTYVLFPDEGHGFARPENAIAFNAITEEFLARTIGGRAEPAADSVSKSNAQFLSRAE
jgi:dipeptidyl aminopeptidase/acylaminoacyl peptidase